MLLFILILITVVLNFLLSVGQCFGLEERDVRAWFGVREFSHQGDGYPLTVHFIDVGDGDSILICHGEQTILIDTGKESLQGTVRNYLKHYGVRELDLFIATHTDSDHIGDFASIAETFPIRQVFLSANDRTEEQEQTPAFQVFEEALQEYGIPVSDPGRNTYRSGKMELTFLSPQKHYSDENDNSLVIRLCYGEISYLLTGDIGEKAERDLLSSGEHLQSTVLKVAHHGSKTSTTQPFYEAVSPQYAVISASGYHQYLPDRSVVDRIKDGGTTLLRTDHNGSVIIATDGKTVAVYCEKEES